MTRINFTLLVYYISYSLDGYDVMSKARASASAIAL